MNRRYLLKSLLLAPLGYYVGNHIQTFDEPPLMASVIRETGTDLIQAMGMNTEEELMKAIAAQIAKEIDDEILRSLIWESQIQVAPY